MIVTLHIHVLFIKVKGWYADFQMRLQIALVIADEDDCNQPKTPLGTTDALRTGEWTLIRMMISGGAATVLSVSDSKSLVFEII